MPHEVTMPQLGMAQETGVILSWRKEPGDDVKADDVLMEVETDKATMEVEAGFAGFLVEVRAAAGTSVPVGEVIAIISEAADDARAAAPGPKKEPSAERVTPLVRGPVSAPVVPSRPVTTVPTATRSARAPDRDDRVLASPKAQWEAHRRGIPLEGLVRQGVSQPLHVADLDLWRPGSAPSPDGAYAAPPSVLKAEVDGSALADLADWVKVETQGGVTSMSLWAALACGAWRQTSGLGSNEPVMIEIAQVARDAERLAVRDADRGGLSEIVPSLVDGDLDLIVRDLTGTSLTDYRPGKPSAVPVLVVTAAASDRLALAFHFDEERLSFIRAAIILQAIAERVRNPLKYLL